MNGAPLASIKHERDLGVWISSDLTLNKHVNEQCAQANKMLSYIRRNTRTIYTIKQEEPFTCHWYDHILVTRRKSGHLNWTSAETRKIPKMCNKYILNLPFISSVSYKSRLQTLHLLPICYWHEYLDMINFFKLGNSWHYQLVLCIACQDNKTYKIVH
jgi:hypothetical protein